MPQALNSWLDVVPTVRMHWSVAAIHCSKFCRQTHTHTNRAQRLPACPLWRGSLPPLWVPRIVCGNSKLSRSEINRNPKFQEIPTCLLKTLRISRFSVWKTVNPFLPQPDPSVLTKRCLGVLQVSCRAGASPCCWLGSPESPGTDSTDSTDSADGADSTDSIYIYRVICIGPCENLELLSFCT